jgi:hypothetical protein
MQDWDESCSPPIICGNTRHDPARASDFIGHALNEIRPGCRVVPVARVSHYSQTKPIRQLSDVYIGIRELGAEVVGAHARVCSGWHPSWLRPALSLALRLNAVLVAMSTNRYIRNYAFHTSQNPVLPTKLDFHRMDTMGVRLFTILHPDTPENEVKSDQTKRGLRGPMIKKERRCLLRPLVVDLHRHGHSLRDIEKMIQVVSFRTIKDWLS